MNLKAYLHDFVKSLLIYEPKEAFKAWEASGINKKFLKGEILFSRGEPKGNDNFFDIFVVSTYKKADKYGIWRVIGEYLFIEVKTGKFHEKWVEQLNNLYQDRRTAFKNLFTTFSYDYKEKRWKHKEKDIIKWLAKQKYGDLPIHANTRLILICPKSEIKKVEQELQKIDFRHGTHFQILPIEPLYPLIKERVEKLNKFL